MNGAHDMDVRSPLLALILLVGGWESVRWYGGLNESVFPSAYHIFTSALGIVPSERFWIDVGATVGRALGGFSAAAIAGVSVGLVVGRFRPLKKVFLPFIDFFRSIPVTTLYPAFVLLLGLGDISKIAMVFFACFFIIALNAAYGIAFSSPIRTQIAQLYGATPWFLFWRVSAPEALPQIFIGLRISLSLAFIIAILVEMFMGANFGIGQRVMEFYSIYNTSGLYTYVFAAGMLGYILNRGFASIERRMLHWVAQ